MHSSNRWGNKRKSPFNTFVCQVHPVCSWQESGRRSVCEEYSYVKGVSAPWKCRADCFLNSLLEGRCELLASVIFFNKNTNTWMNKKGEYVVGNPFSHPSETFALSTSFDSWDHLHKGKGCEYLGKICVSAKIYTRDVQRLGWVPLLLLDRETWLCHRAAFFCTGSQKWARQAGRE